MMSKMKVMMGMLTIACMVTWLLGITSDASSVTPGSVNDPIVTKSYVDQKVGAIKVDIDARLLAIENDGSVKTSTETEPTITGDVDMTVIYKYIDDKVATMGDTTSVSDGINETANTGLFTVVEATKGQKIICGASAEIILRAGSATVIASADNEGLADLTSGSDLRGDAQVPSQHHLLVSRDDGRGLLITSDMPDTEIDAYILVKGAYTVK